MRVNTAPRRQNSHRADEGRRFPQHLQWLRGRPCLLWNRRGHTCEGKIEAAHVDHAGGKGVALKVADFNAVPLCGASHQALHRMGRYSWEAHWNVKLIEAAQDYAKASPHRHLWEAQR